MAAPGDFRDNLHAGSSTSSVAGLSHGGCGNVAQRSPDQTRLAPSVRNTFPHQHRHRGMAAGGYGHDCLPLRPIDGNVTSVNQNPDRKATISTRSSSCNNGRHLNFSNLLGNSGHNVRSFPTHGANLLCEGNGDSCNITNGTPHKISQVSFPTLHTRHMCTPTHNRMCTNETRWAQPVQNMFISPAVSVSSEYNQFWASKDVPVMIDQTPSGGSMSKHYDNELDTKSDHLFAVPRHPDWSHFTTVPSIAPSTLNGSDNGSQSIPLPDSTASHCNTCSNQSHFHGNDIESFPSRFTSPLHSASVHTRRLRKRALSRTPSISDGLDLNSIIRISPTSLFTCLLPRHSSTSGSPPPCQQGSFSHLSARNSSPYFQHGSGQRGIGDNVIPLNMAPSENNLMEEIMRNAYVASKDDMPYIEQNYYSGNLHNDLSEIQNRQANGCQRCCCVAYASSQADNFTLAAVHPNCTEPGGVDAIPSSTNEALQRHHNFGMCIRGVVPPPSNIHSEHHQHHPHWINQNHIHHHYLHQQHHHMACNSASHAVVSSNEHARQNHHQPQANQPARDIRILDQLHHPLNSCLGQRMPVNSRVVESFSPRELQQVNSLSLNPTHASTSSLNMDNAFSLEDSTQTEGSVSGPGDCEEDDPMVCGWRDCNLMFRDQQELVRHLSRVHMDQKKEGEFTCLWENCTRNSRPFNARYKLVIHMRVHTKEKPHKCLVEGCTKAFPRLENLRIHLRSHTGERPYVCDFNGCLRAFSNSSDRSKHKKIHIDPRPHVCQTRGCGKSYTDPSSLRKHVKSHSREQLHQQLRQQPHQQQQKKKLKNGRLGRGAVNTCLTIQKLKPEGFLPEVIDLARSPHNGPNSDVVQSFGFHGSVSSRCGTASVASSMGSQQSPGVLRVLEEASESRSGFPSMRSPQPLPPIPQQTRPLTAAVHSRQYGHDRQLFPLGQQVSELPTNMQQQQQQLMRPYYPHNLTGFSSCRMGAMQAQRMMDMQDFDPESFNLPLDDLVQSESLGVPNDVSMQEYLQLSAIDRCNSHTSIYADGST